MEFDKNPLPQLPSTTEELMDLLDAEAERLQLLRQAIAATAVSSEIERETLLAAADHVIEAASGIKNGNETVAEPEAVEALEPFGDEESYWTVYRMFASARNLGQLRTIDEIFMYLSGNYDMANETPDSVATTLADWAGDIENDAREKGITGLFTRHENGFVFAETATSHIARKLDIPTAPILLQPAPKPRKSKAPEAPVEIPVPEVEPEPLTLTTAIQVMLEYSLDGSLKQAHVKSALHDSDYDFDTTHLQRDIDEAVRNGELFKFRRQKVAYLSLTAREDEITTTPEAPSESVEDSAQLETEAAINILRALTAPGRHVSQRMTIGELWRVIHDAENKSQTVPADEAERLKVAARQLQSMSFVTAGGEKIGTGGVRTNSATSSKRRRSGSMFAYKVGIVNQSVKKDVQGLLDDPHAAEWLEAQFSERSMSK